MAGDSSGFGNDGTVYGATWVDGKYGKALGFDGTNDYVEVPHHSSINLMGPMTVTIWNKVTGTPNDYDEFVHKYSLGTPSYGYALDGMVSQKVRMYINNGSWKYVESNTAFTIGIWYHVVGVYDGTYIRIYINGAEEGTPQAQGAPVGNTEPLRIGAKTPTDYLIPAVIDEVRVYNQALSADEIETLFQKGPDFSSRLLAKVPKGTTQFIVTLSWQGVGSMNVTIESPSKNYTEDIISVYQKTVYSSSSGDMLNIKRLAVSVTALSYDENWYILLEFDNVEDYRITVEVQR